MTVKTTASPTPLPSPLVAAVRGFVAEAGQPLTTLAKPKQVRSWTLPQYVLVFDTETTLDPSQRLLFGVYRLCRWVVDRHGATVLRVVEEGLIHDDGLDEWNPEGYAVLREYAGWRSADTARGCSRVLTCRSREAFIREVFLPFAFKRRALVVGFNLPFDLSRIAAGDSPARGQGDDGLMWGGWSLRLRVKPDGKDVGAVPRILIQHINKNLAFFRFTAAEFQDWSKPKEDRPKRPTFRGHFLDLKTLCFALSDKSYSLRDAGAAFRATVIKSETPELGAITDETITYCRDDVRATQALFEAVLAEYQRHPIGLAPWEVHSPATIAKGYLRAMGIPPFLARVDGISAETLGQAHSAYFGGRTEARIRQTVVPVMVLDYTATYPAVHILLQTQAYLTAGRLRTEDFTAAARDALARITPDTVCNRTFWPDLRFFAEVEPNGDVLPVRAQYRSANDTYNVAVNPVTSDRSLWYAGPDLAASILLSGKQPTIRRAFRLVADGTLESLRPVRYRGELTIDPRPGRHDIFQRIVEERYRVKASALPEAQLEASVRGLKVISTAGSYGVMAQFTERPVRRRGKRRGKLAVHAGGEGIPVTPTAVERPGEYCFPPVAALITSGARLLLALAERLVADRGGVFLTMDTDSIFVVASEHGGPVPCVGGSATLPDGRSAVRALPWNEVQAILTQIDQLKPYGAVVTDSLLKIEKVNRAGEHGPFRQLFGLAMAAKRYCVFTESAEGTVAIVKSSRHGLGTLLDPSSDGTPAAKGERDDPDRGWLAEVWRRFVARAIGRPELPWPIWVDRPAVVRFTASSPRRLRPFLDDLKTQPYATRLKPFNFMIVAHVRPGGAPDGADPNKIRLVTGYQRDASQWREAIWRDLYAGTRPYRVTTGDYAGPDVAMVKTVRVMIEEYWTHPEAKSLAPDGSVCGGLTRGLLRRQPVVITGLVAIGKEANGLSDLEDHVVATAGEVQHVYRLPAASQWDALVRPKLARLASNRAVAALARVAGVAPRTVRRWVRGSWPRDKARLAVLRWARRDGTFTHGD